MQGKDCRGAGGAAGGARGAAGRRDCRAGAAAQGATSGRPRPRVRWQAGHTVCAGRPARACSPQRGSSLRHRCRPARCAHPDCCSAHHFCCPSLVPLSPAAERQPSCPCGRAGRQRPAPRDPLIWSLGSTSWQRNLPSCARSTERAAGLRATPEGGPRVPTAAAAAACAARGVSDERYDVESKRCGKNPAENTLQHY